MSCMNFRLPAFLALATILVAHPARGQHAHTSRATAVAAAPDTSARGDTGVATTIRALFAAAERNDLAALDTLYAGDSLTVVEGTGVNRGWTDYRDNHLGPEMKEMKNFRYRPFEIQARASGNLGWATFRYALSAEVEGKLIDVVGRGTAILERRGNRWVVRHTQTTSRPRRPTDPAMPR